MDRSEGGLTPREEKEKCQHLEEEEDRDKRQCPTGCDLFQLCEEVSRLLEKLNRELNILSSQQKLMQEAIYKKKMEIIANWKGQE